MRKERDKEINQLSKHKQSDDACLNLSKALTFTPDKLDLTPVLYSLLMSLYHFIVAPEN